MSGGRYTVEVTNLSSKVAEKDLYNFFSFSGFIEHIEIYKNWGYGSTAYVTFKEPYALETAVLLSGATIVDQPVCITRWGQYEEACNFWDRPSWKVEDDTESSVRIFFLLFFFLSTSQHINIENASRLNGRTSSTQLLREAFTMAQDVVKAMLSKGYELSKDAMIKAKAFDESHQVSSTPAAKVAEFGKKVGLTDKIYAGIIDIVEY
ncbi:Binding partner of ACD11 1, partial [Ananas comosus]